MLTWHALANNEPRNIELYQHSYHCRWHPHTAHQTEVMLSYCLLQSPLLAVSAYFLLQFLWLMCVVSCYTLPAFAGSAIADDIFFLHFYFLYLFSVCMQCPYPGDPYTLIVITVSVAIAYARCCPLYRVISR